MKCKNLISEVILIFIALFRGNSFSISARDIFENSERTSLKKSIHIFGIIAFLMLNAGFIATAQTTYYWVGGASASYSDANSWNTNLGGGGSARSSTDNKDILIFDGSDISSVAGLQTGSIDANTVINQTIGNLILQNSADVTLSSGGGVTISLRNNAGTDLIINTFSKLTMGSSVNITLNNNTAALIDGTLQIDAGITFDTDNNNVLSTINGTINNSGTVLGTTTTLVFNTGSNYYHSRDGGNIPTATWDASSNCNISDVTTTVPGVLNQDFGNFLWNCPLQTGNLNIADLNSRTIFGNFSLISTGTGSLQFVTTVTDRSFSVSKDFNISGGTLELSAQNGTGTIAVAGNFTMSGGLITETAGGNGAIVFNGTTNQNFFKSGGAFANDIDFTVNNGAILNMGTSIIDGSSGTFTLSNGGTLITGSTLGITNSPTLAGSIQNTGTRNFNTGANYEYNGTLAQVTGVGLPVVVNNLKINNPAGVSLSQSVTINDHASFTSGAFILNASTLTLNNTVSTGSGSITGSAASTISVTGNNTPEMTLPPITGSLGNFTLNKTGTTNAVNLGADLVLDASGTSTLTAGLLNSIYNITVNGSTACGGGSINATNGTVLYSSAAAQNIFAGNYLNISKAGAGTATLCNAIIVNGNLLISAGYIDVGGANYTITLHGDWTDSNVGDGFIERSGTVELVGSAIQNISKPAGETFYNLTINNPSGIRFADGNITASNSLYLVSGNVNINGYIFALNNASTTSLIRSTGHIYGGVFRRSVNTTTGSYLFPVGTNNYYNSCTIGFTGTVPSGSIDLQYFSADPTNYGGLPLSESGINISSHYTDGYWSVKSSTGYASTYDLTLNAEGFTSNTVDQSTRIIKRTNNGNWTLSGTHTIQTPPVCKRTGVSGIDTGGNTTIFGLGKTDCITINTDPSDVSTCAGQNAGFSVSATGTGLTYRWQRNGVDLVDGGSYSNTGTSSMLVTGVSASETGLYRCKITSTCTGSPIAFSNNASLSLSSPFPSLGYKYSRNITIDQSMVLGSSDLLNFPVLISGTYPFLKSVLNGGMVENSSGYDIIFTDNNGFKLDHQIEKYDPVSGEFIAWVRIPLLYTYQNTSMKMLYGNPQVTVDPSTYTTIIIKV